MPRKRTGGAGEVYGKTKGILGVGNLECGKRCVQAPTSWTERLKCKRPSVGPTVINSCILWCIGA
jgi:hypothetical protein